MKSKLLFLMLCLIIFSCKKESLSNDCRLVEQFSIFNNDKITCYYYDRSNRVTGRTFFGKSASLIPSATVMLYDSIAYNSSELVTVYRFECFFSPFSKDTLPYHGNDFYAKIENVLQKGKIVNSKLYDGSRKPNLVLSDKEYNYSNDNITKITENGRIITPLSYRAYVKKISSYTYEGRNVKSVLSDVFDEDGFRVGGDTLIVNAYLGFKNPFRNLQFDYDIPPTSFSENLNADYNFRYYYGNRFGIYFSSGSEKGSSPKYTDNGKNYPKELGTYLCD